MNHDDPGVRRLLGRALMLGAMMAVLSVSTALAANGNKGTVKVHEGATDVGRIVSEDSHVCTFHLHFFFADAGQAGDWTIDQTAPTGDAAAVISGSYLTDGNGEYQTVEYGLPIGHYSLSWDGRSDQNAKHKTFWVTCANSPGPIGGIG